MIYTTCKYAPEELFVGFGESVQRLDPNPVSFSCADGCAHPNLCGFAKAIIEEVNARGIQNLIITDCCDAMRRAYDVLKAREMDFLYFLPLPHKSGAAEQRLFARSLSALTEACAQRTHTSFSWRSAFEACLHNMRPPKLPEGPYISLLGAHGGKALLEQTQALMPGLPVRDETCSGPRAFSPVPVPETASWRQEDFFFWYAGLLLSGLKPCMRMHASRPEPIRQDQQRGVIYHTIKFCDYYSFEYAGVKDSQKVPILKIETDTTPQSSGQLKTRLEAFAETLGEGKSARREEKAMHKYAAGIDSGSTSTDVVILNDQRAIVGSAIVPTGMSASKSASEALELALRQAGLTRGDLGEIVSTGYGRDALSLGGRTVTEITCHAKGAHLLFPQARTIIDIGGQDSKVIRVDEAGGVRNFIMNDKCAAGTGRFLEMQARALGLSMDEMRTIGLKWKTDVQISNMCTVFAESEVVSLVARDTDIADIVHGLNMAVAAKTVSLITRGKGEPAFAMTGGVSRNDGVVQCLEKLLDCPVQISQQSQLCGAIGAALFALE